MAERKEILSDLSSKIAEGNIREAYRTFEDLPVVDQIAVSISPGVGDALAAYEVGEFGARAKTNIAEGDILGGAGNIGLSALSGISLIPLFRFLRGARGVTKSASKTVDAPTTPDKPPIEEPLQLSPPKKVEPELPEVQPFQPKGIDETSYNIGQMQIKLGSKARKWVNGLHPQSPGKKVQELAPEEWVKRLLNAGIPKGELRLLRILDEANEINPKFLNETAGRKTVSREFLDDYMDRSQRDAIQMRGVPKENLASPDTRFANEDLQQTQNQAVYFVRGSGEYRGKSDHYSGLKYPDGTEGNKAYVFDGVGTTDPRGRYTLAYGFDDSSEYIDKGKEIKKAFDELDIKDGDYFDSIFRVQSDFQGEVADTYLPRQVREFNDTKNVIGNIDALQLRNINNARNSYAQEMKVLLGGSSTQAGAFGRNLDANFVDALVNNDMDKVQKFLGDDLYKVFTDTDLANRIPGKFFTPNDGFIDTGYERAVSFTEVIDDIFRNDTSMKSPGRLINRIFGDKSAIKPDKQLSKIVKELGGKEEVAPVIEEIFKRREAIEKIKKKILGKSPASRGGFVDPAQQKVILRKLKDYNKQVDLVNKALADGVPVDIDKISDALNEDVLRFGIDKLDITPRDIERITGRPFSESLDKTPEEIYYTMEGGRQKYFDVPNNPADLAKAYFDDIASQGDTMLELADGVKALKKAVSVNAKDFGMKIDPYFDGGNSKYMKLPVRARVLDAYRKGRQGVHIGNKQAQTEGSPERIVQQYTSGEKEIQKILDELIPNRANQKGMISKVEGTDTEYDGTYLKFTDELVEAIKDKGIDAFKLGGPVEIDRMLAEL
tara:strand:- start:402 stop:2900 length:2499 start_codon:yes stop_codon:yes gene_type:complete